MRVGRLTLSVPDTGDIRGVIIQAAGKFGNAHRQDIQQGVKIGLQPAHINSATSRQRRQRCRYGSFRDVRHCFHFCDTRDPPDQLQIILRISPGYALAGPIPADGSSRQSADLRQIFGSTV